MKQEPEQIQNAEREILKEFIRVCNENGLRYFLAEGSLLGAVRHGGMIPWDDDIDVAMFREDYEKFLLLAPEKLGADFECLNWQRTKGYIECMTKVIDRQHRVRSCRTDRPDEMNVWIDIFPIDGMPSGRFAQKLHRFRLLYRKLMVMWSDVDHYATPRKRPRYEQMLITLARRLQFKRFIRTKRQLEKLRRALMSVPAKENTVSFLSEYRFTTVCPADVYGKGQTVLFDGIPAVMPEKPEVLLQAEYGDYMKLPPEKDRYKHQLEYIG